MAYEKRPGDGTLWVNDRKEKDSHPDRKGDALIHCPHCSRNFEVWLSGWIKKGKGGDPFLSMSIKSKDDPGAAPRGERRNQPPPDARPAAPRPPPPPPPDDPEDDIPF